MDYIKIPHSLYKSLVLMEKELKDETYQQGLEILRLERELEEKNAFIYDETTENATTDGSDAE